MSAPAFEPDDQPTRSPRGRSAPLPRSRDVLLAHIRAVGLMLRQPAMLASAFVVLITVVVVLQGVSMGPVVNLYEWPTMMPGIMGALMPIAVWMRDERLGPAFVWTLPVDRRRHALAKVVAGWIWLMVGVAVVAAWLLAMTFAASGSVLPPDTLHVVSTKVFEGQAIDPAGLRTAHWSPGSQLWVVPFTAATATYLLASAFALGSRHPLRWLIGSGLGYFVASVAAQAASTQWRAPWLSDAPTRGVQFVVEARYGLDALLTARTATLSTTAFLATGERALIWRGVPDLADWRLATLIWTGGGLLALWAATSRHAEQRRG